MSLPANMATQAATRSTTWARCAKIHAADGTIIAITEHDKDLGIDLGDGDGELTYKPDAVIELTEGRASADLSIDNLDVIGAIESSLLTHDDIHRGRYDNGHLTVFEVDWSNPNAGQKIHFEGPLGEVQTDGREFTLEVRSWTAYMSRVISQTIGPQCRKSFGSQTTADERKPNEPCGVVLDPPDWQASTAYAATADGDQKVGDRVSPTTPNGFIYRCTVAGTSDASEPSWPTTVDATVVDGGVTWQAERALKLTGTVATVSSQISITATGIDVEEDFFARGFINWLTGNNVGIGNDTPVATDDGSGALTFYRPPVRTVQAGDTFEIFAGCDKSQDACVGYSNWENHNGILYVPPRTV